MGTSMEWFWCRGCHRAFSAEVCLPPDKDNAGHDQSVDFSDMSAAVVCPFRDCEAMHVMPWSVMRGSYGRRLGRGWPEEPVAGKRYEIRRPAQQPAGRTDCAGPAVRAPGCGPAWAAAHGGAGR